MRRACLLSALVLLAFGLFAPPTHGWSFKEHILLTRLAVARLLADPATPEDMKLWLREVAPTAGDEASARQFLLETHVGPDPVGLQKLDYWVIFPDIARQIDGNQPVAPFGVPEAPMHFVDVEFFIPADAVKQYKHDLSNKPALEQLPRDWRDPRLVQAGYLPWRVEQVYGQLVEAIRAGRLLPAGEGDRDNALVLAGYLAHYLADNTQPQHATIDYKSGAYFAIPQRAPNVHGMLEYGMVDWEGRPYPELRAQLWEKMQAILKSADLAREHLNHFDGVVEAGRVDPWISTAQISLASYDALPLIGTAAQVASGQAVEAGDPTRPVGAPAREAEQFDIEAFFTHRGVVNGREMSLLDLKARQLALATLRIETLLRQAWLEARKPASTTAPATEPATLPTSQPDAQRH